MKTIFISHSSKDDRFVDNIRRDLHRRGYRTWVDHHDIPTGELWDKVVDKALHDSDAMLLVLTPASMNSKEVDIEWREFRTLEKPIFPLRLQECPIPLLIRHLQYIDFSDEAAYEKQLKKLLKTLPPLPPSITKDLALDTDEFEMVRIRQQLAEMRSKLQGMVGLGQILFAFPALQRTSIFDLDHDRLIIGWNDKKSGAMVDIDLSKFAAFERGVSRQHAEITRLPSGLLITDLGSNNGTFINEHRLPPHKPLPLLNECILHLGQLAIQVYYREDAFSH